jgi:hypothetical protein
VLEGLAAVFMFVYIDKREGIGTHETRAEAIIVGITGKVTVTEVCTYELLA